MHEVKDTRRALVRIGYDSRVHKTFRGHQARERFENECRILKYLEARECEFVPRLLASDPSKLYICTSNCGRHVDHLPDDRVQELFAELEAFGVKHDDPFLRNITYRVNDGRFCIIDFELASIIGEDNKPLEAPTPGSEKT